MTREMLTPLSSCASSAAAQTHRSKLQSQKGQADTKWEQSHMEGVMERPSPEEFTFYAKAYGNASL